MEKEKQVNGAPPEQQRDPDVVFEIRFDAPQAQAKPQESSEQPEQKADSSPEQKKPEVQASGGEQASQTQQDPQQQPVEQRSEQPQQQGGIEQFPSIEAPQAHMPGINTRTRGLKLDDEFAGEVLMRAILPKLQMRRHTPQELQELENVLRSRGLSMRTLNLDTTGAVFYDEIARQFTVKPSPDAIARNHWTVVPMRGVRSVTAPSLDSTGITTTWGRRGGTAPTESDPTTGSYDITVDNIEAFVPVGDDYLLFNPAGTRFIQEVLIPSMREKLHYDEDTAFFLSDGAAPYSTKFVGLKNVSGVTEVAPTGANGDPISLAKLDEMIRAMPPAHRRNRRELAFYLADDRALDIQSILGQRQTGLGDQYIMGLQERGVIAPGPLPVAVYNGIPVYGVAQLPVNETVGTSSNASTGFLVNRRILALGDGSTLRIEPLREKGFTTLLQMQEWVGLGYAAWKAAIVRATGLLPKA
ncbi:phage major capsid protein [Oceanithermus sp.]|uniref:phage major capsid protein n=1 Tax=Oceanithermus sp. TaxID=2268145 RepID=UPI0025D229B3|nr:phage major capsid protein [Oceanithermus sp.]